ncbi:hypothetical protein L484_001957 [Morus notabilis]|uniref:Uncharacterized protein n=1 Tax=Morus notabilis TaxID=981085 RepID=W9SPK5_9ROSA|nr:hypothetical protein L484_001957 [Morus notabilis]
MLKKNNTSNSPVLKNTVLLAMKQSLHRSKAKQDAMAANYDVKTAGDDADYCEKELASKSINLPSMSDRNYQELGKDGKVLRKSKKHQNLIANSILTPHNDSLSGITLDGGKDPLGGFNRCAKKEMAAIGDANMRNLKRGEVTGARAEKGTTNVMYPLSDLQSLLFRLRFQIADNKTV